MLEASQLTKVLVSPSRHATSPLNTESLIRLPPIRHDSSPLLYYEGFPRSHQEQANDEKKKQSPDACGIHNGQQGSDVPEQDDKLEACWSIQHEWEFIKAGLLLDYVRLCIVALRRNYSSICS